VLQQEISMKIDRDFLYTLIEFGNFEGSAPSKSLSAATPALGR